MSFEKKNVVACPICKAKNLINTNLIAKNSGPKCENIQPVFNNKKHAFFQNQYLIICQECTFSFSFPFISNDSLDSFYNDDWSKVRLKEMIRSSSIKLKPSINLISRLMSVLIHCNMSNKVTFLDFGGSDGQVVQLFNLLFPDSEAYVSDSNIYLKCWENRKVKYRDLSNFDDNSIDIFYCSHTLEHFSAADLHSFLLALNKKLKKGAIVYIEVPNEDLHQFFNSGFDILYNPGPHLSHFNTLSLQKLVSDYFQIISIEVRGKENRYGVNKVDIPKISKMEKSKGFYARLLSFVLRKIRSFIVPADNYSYKQDFYFHRNDLGDYLCLVAKK